MISQQIYGLCAYLGVKCDYSDQHITWNNEVLSLMILREVEYRLILQNSVGLTRHNTFKLTVYLSCLDSLPRQECNKMWKELNLHQESAKEDKDFIFEVMIQAGEPDWRELGWLQKRGYYFNEASIMKYVVLKNFKYINHIK